jgi:penicillin amidase/acyl-homoserine-lactone acylase
MRRRFAPALALLAAAACAGAGGAPPADDGPAAYDVRILRDTWGVPHVFGRRDVDVAFGIAWAHAEDDFETTQVSLLAARGRLAALRGRGAAVNDFLVAWLRLPEAVEAAWTRELSPATRALAEAYADGLNRYAAAHPDEVLPGVLPVRGQDLAAGFAHKNALFILGDDLRALFDETRAPGARPSAEARAWSAASAGSNAFAVGPRRSADGRTRLAVNSHQPWEGPVAWYEAHLKSDEGWEAVGGLFPGSPVILHGHNRQLGWAHTVNKPDLVDVYRLELDPADPDRYRFDGEWRQLERRDVPIRVKLLGPLAWTFHREALWSVHGPVLRRADGAWAVRFAGMGEAGQLEQTYAMNRARSLGEWLRAMDQNRIAMFNTAYADREGNVYYVYNAKLPRRPAGFDWSGVLPGDTSAALWREYLPFSELPQVLNPPSGFVQNCNSTPFRTTDGRGNPRPEEFDPSLGIETQMTNRALRALEVYGADPSIGADEFEAYKFDVAYSRESDVARWLREIAAAPPPDDALAREAQARLARWDLRADPDNPNAALAILTLSPLFEAQREGRPLPDPLAQLGRAARTLRRHHGRLDPPWSEVNRLRRGATDLGLGGAPDVLHAVYGRGPEDGRLVGMAGDSYVLLVEFGPDGVRSKSIHQYGSATDDPRSPHYADQAPLFARRTLKPVWLDEPEIRAHLEREYRPGSEGREEGRSYFD